MTHPLAKIWSISQLPYSAADCFVVILLSFSSLSAVFLSEILFIWLQYMSKITKMRCYFSSKFKVHLFHEYQQINTHPMPKWGISWWNQYFSRWKNIFLVIPCSIGHVIVICACFCHPCFQDFYRLIFININCAIIYYMPLRSWVSYHLHLLTEN